MNKATVNTLIACDQCRWFLEQERGLGTCHRYPPSFAGESAAKDFHHWKFPMVSNHSWCGEFCQRADELAPTSGRHSPARV